MSRFLDAAETERLAAAGPLEELVLPCAEDAPWEQGRSEEDPFDLDAIAFHAFEPHLLDDLNELEREVLCSRFGLDGHPERTMRELHHQLGVSRAALRDSLGSALTKIRSHLLD